MKLNRRATAFSIEGDRDLEECKKWHMRAKRLHFLRTESMLLMDPKLTARINQQKQQEQQQRQRMLMENAEMFRYGQHAQTPLMWHPAPQQQQTRYTWEFGQFQPIRRYGTMYFDILYPPMPANYGMGPAVSEDQPMYSQTALGSTDPLNIAPSPDSFIWDLFDSD